MIIFLQQHRCYFNVIDYKHTPVNVPVSPLEQGFLGQLKNLIMKRINTEIKMLFNLFRNKVVLKSLATKT